MDKIRALANEQQQEDLRFRERLVLCDKVIKMKNEMENMQKQEKSLQQEITMMELQVLQMETDVKMLDTQREEITKTIRDKLTRVILDEDKLKNVKEFFNNVLEEKIEQTKEFLSNLEANDKNLSAVETETVETKASRKRVWALRGEIEALELFENYQTKKIQEMNYIASKVEEVFQENVNDNDIVM